MPDDGPDLRQRLFQARYLPIDRYGLIGDLHSCALVGADGAIDWCCLPDFDSPSVFGAVLDHARGGSCAVALVDARQCRQAYLRDTNILCTTTEGPRGAVEVVDYMPVLDSSGDRPERQRAYICRHVECLHGLGVEVEVRFEPKPNYGRTAAGVTFEPHGASEATTGLRLQSSLPIAWQGTSGVGRLRLDHGDSARLVLTFGRDQPIPALVGWSDARLSETRNFWERWLDHCLYTGRWRRLVERSALALKLLTFQPTGAILAAPTASLPEAIGGPRNWDYRFSWLRDSALILNALFLLGYRDEAEAFVHWIMTHRPAANAGMAILYPIGRADTTPELVLDHLEGYRGSTPVRIGNAAADQLQLDVYGEIIDTIYRYDAFGHPVDAAMWAYVVELCARIVRDWQLADEGIWEVRAGRQHFTHSKLMCWIGLDRAIRIGRGAGLAANFGLWVRVRDQIDRYLRRECVAPGGGLAQSAGSDAVDASTLLAIILGYLEPTDPLAVATVDRVQAELVRDGMVFRYLADDGLEGEEGTFNLCTFWLAEALAILGRVTEARALFEQMVERIGPLGLYAEETDPATGTALGNYPQAFSHVGLINAALRLNRLLG